MICILRQFSLQSTDLTSPLIPKVTSARHYWAHNLPINETFNSMNVQNTSPIFEPLWRRGWTRLFVAHQIKKAKANPQASKLKNEIRWSDENQATTALFEWSFYPYINPSWASTFKRKLGHLHLWINYVRQSKMFRWYFSAHFFVRVCDILLGSSIRS